MIFLLAVALACICEKLGLPASDCVNDTFITSSSYDFCTYTQASIDCGFTTCAEAIPARTYCTLVCECAPGCTMNMLAGGSATYCAPACDNAVCNHCLPAGTQSTFFSDCPSLGPEVELCLNGITTIGSCDSYQAYIDCYAGYPCLSDKIATVCRALQLDKPNCTFDCTSGGKILHAAIALLFSL